MKMKWTPKQQEAIFTNNTNIIVSAGAGSGKTAVLTERIKQKILSGVKLDQLLVLTFTNAAAHEMKDRVKKAISGEPSIAHLSKDVDSAYITTFDSYALSFVKKYSYILNIDSNLSIVENTVINIEKTRIIDEIMENRYITLPKDFKSLASTFFIKDDTSFKKEILKISDKLDLRFDKNIYLDNYIENHFTNPSFINNAINKFENYVINLINELACFFEEEIYPLLDDKLLNKCYELYNPLFDCTNFDDVVSYMNSFTKHIVFKSDEPSLKEKVLEMKNNYFSVLKKLCDTHLSINDIKSNILSTQPYVNAVISIIKELDEKINDFKYKHSLFEFSDIAKLAIKILTEHEDIRLELKNQLHEILVDEYQDTSDLQEKFIELVENNNVYMVGDVKQSIYRFRNANPIIFKSKYDTYRLDRNKGLKIDLTNNFRSRNEVVSTINHIFNQIMFDDVGGANYKQEHQMIYGNHSYDSLVGTQSFNSEILTYEFDKDCGLSKEETEIRIIAQDILEKINNNFQVVDKETKQMRNASFKDFCILASGSYSFELIRDIFKEYNIDTLVHKNEKINSNILVFILKNILILTIKHYQKTYDVDFNYAFVSVARSFLCEYDDNQIFDIVTNKAYLDDDIIKLIDEAVIELPYISMSSLLKKLLDSFNFYEKLLKVDDSNMNLIRLEYFISLCDKLDNLNINMEDYPTYLETIFSDENPPEISSSMKDIDAVVIMTIHKSKGLEFPIVYLPFLYKHFNFQDLNDRFIYDNRYGIISPYFNEGIDHTLFKDLLKLDYKKDEISERIRVFYVALTRAKEKLIFIHQYEEETKKIHPSKISSFDDLLLMIEDSLSSYRRKIDITQLPNINNKSSKQKDKIISNKEYIVKDTHLVAESLEKARASKTMDSLINQTTYDNMQMGLHIHEILEYIDYDNPEEILVSENAWIKNKVYSFLNLFIFKNKGLNNYYREYAFTYSLDNVSYNGIIDLVVETPTNIYIIDYKMKHIDDPDYINQLSIYHQYITSKFNKPVSVYLYSFIDEKLSEIKITNLQK